MSTRTVTILSDHPKDNVPTGAPGFVLILGHDYDADATPDKGKGRPEPIPTLMFGGSKPSVVLNAEDEQAFRRVHQVLDAIMNDAYGVDADDA